MLLVNEIVRRKEQDEDKDVNQGALLLIEAKRLDGPHQGEGAQISQEEEIYYQPDTGVIKCHGPKGDSHDNGQSDREENEENPPGGPIDKGIDTAHIDSLLDSRFFLKQQLVRHYHHDGQVDQDKVDLKEAEHGISLLIEYEGFDFLGHNHVHYHGVRVSLALQDRISHEMLQVAEPVVLVLHVVVDFDVVRDRGRLKLLQRNAS